MKIYLDTCVWCRPFDKPTPQIESERRGYLKILRKVYEGKFSIVGSIFLDIEVERIEGGKKRESAKKSMDKAISEKIVWAHIILQVLLKAVQYILYPLTMKY